MHNKKTLAKILRENPKTMTDHNSLMNSNCVYPSVDCANNYRAKNGEQKDRKKMAEESDITKVRSTF